MNYVKIVEISKKLKKVLNIDILDKNYGEIYGKNK
jgi:hypothetical protein